MAEAIKPNKPVKAKNQVSREQSSLSPSSADSIITDKNLQARLKSLTSFINNIEPKPKNKECAQISDSTINTQGQTSQASAPIDDAISENSLSTAPSAPPISKVQLLSPQSQASAPPLLSANSYSMIEKFQLTSDSVIKEPQKGTKNSGVQSLTKSSVADFNLDKIRLVNKLNYPRLSWNRTTNKLKTLTQHQFKFNNERCLEPEMMEKNLEIDEELMRFFERDQLCKELEVYYKCKQIQTQSYDAFLDEFIREHSNLAEFKYEKVRNQHQIDEIKHGFYELVKDYYEARLLVKKCTRHMNEFKWHCFTNQMRAIWNFEKYTIESNAVCGDQQQVKHELTSEKAFLNKTELTKLQTELYELRLNLIKSGLVSSQYCSKLARVKLESYLHDFLLKVRASDFIKIDQVSKVIEINSELKVLIDILFYFNRKQAKPSMKVLNSLSEEQNGKKSGAVKKSSKTDNIYEEIKENADIKNSNDDLSDKDNEAHDIESDKNRVNSNEGSDNEESDDDQRDEVLKQDIHEWLCTLITIMLNYSEHWRQLILTSKSLNLLQTNSALYQYTNIHFENLFFLVQHFLRSPDSFASNYSYLFQFPLLTIKPVHFVTDLEFILSDSVATENLSDQNRIHNLFLNLNLNSSQSDPLIKIYFDFYLKVVASFSYEPKYRGQFLFIHIESKIYQIVKEHDESEREEAKSPQWELIDSDGDLETLEQTLIDLSEDDLIMLYYQIPFNSIFSFLWSYLSFQKEVKDMNSKKTGVSEGEDFRKRYVSMKLISFLDYLSRLSIRTLLVYNRSKYKNFSKLVGKTLKDSIKFASLVCTKLNMDEAFITHYDNFVKRIFTTIIYSTRCKSIRWIILSQLNIGELCLRTKWVILSIMCGVDVFHEHFEHLFQASTQPSSDQPKPQDYVIQSSINDLENLLTQNEDSKSLSDIELLSFMRTLHFLIDVNKPQDAQSVENDSDDDNDYFEDDFCDQETIKVDRPLKNEETNSIFPSTTSKSMHDQSNHIENEEDSFEFMNCVVKVIFKIAYCYESTKGVCHKEGNSLLFAICSAYPKLIGTVLEEIDRNLDKIGKRSLYLINELPFNKWLPSVDCKKDMDFLEKCLLQTATNSILFCLATTCIDNLNFKQNTKKLSRCLIEKWETKNMTKFSPDQSKNLIDLSRYVQIKLSIVLFELHLRLTVYQYFHKTASESLIDSNSISMEDLNKHYSSLPKDKRLTLVNWIWGTINRLNLYTALGSVSITDALDRLSNIYSPSEAMSTNRVLNSHLNGLLNQISLGSPIESKCPLEKYLNLIFSCTSGDLTCVIERSIDLIHLILSTHKKHSKLQELSYSLVFNWFENLVFKYSTVKLKKRPARENPDSLSESMSLLNEFKLVKNSNIQKFSILLSVILNPSSNHSGHIIDKYCERIIKRLNKFNSIDFKDSAMLEQNSPYNYHYLNHSFLEQQENQRLENYHNYLYLWIEILISTIKNWHKYKNIVKLVDFLISYSFNKESTQSLIENEMAQATQNEPLNSTYNRFINFDLLDEFMSYVRIDFGIINSDPLSNYLTERSQSPDSTHESETSSLHSHSGGPNNWVQPSMHWLSSSLYTMVNNTTSQLSGTMNAAIQAVNSSGISFGSLTNGDFDSNQLQQFTYDKRLYKEFPYVGFYLSLCEERLETQLSLWSTFRSYLLGTSEFPNSSPSDQVNMNSQSFIDSCWRKTLHHINKTHGSSLSFPSQRLMLFKWCERALELPHDHPLLILYWQKFFGIYLDKDYYSSLTSISTQVNVNHSSSSYELELTSTSVSPASPEANDARSNHATTNSSVKSPTLKLFTTTSQQNSLLKQIKKQLELTSEYYAYRCHNNQQQNTGLASRSATNFHYNELMSKLYYALSLWTDETRLHDPNLFLPALPAHYEPNLLAKVFSKQTELWTQFVDLTQLHDKIDLIIKKSDSGQSKKLKANAANRRLGPPIYFFKQDDRMVLSMPTLSQLGIKLRCALNEKYGSSLDTLLRIDSPPTSASQYAYSMTSNQKEQIQLVVNISEHLIRNIFKYNKEMINSTLNHMLKLDDKLINKLIIHLWSNEMCEKYVQVPCTSLINPMHQCTRPAMIKFVYELATKRDQFRHEIKENRFNYEKLLSNFTESSYTRNSSSVNRFPHDEIIKSMVAMNQLIKRLLRNHHIYQQQPQQQPHNVSAHDSNNQLLLTRLFYLFIDLYETQMHHPNDILNFLNNSILKKSKRENNPDIQMGAKDWSLLLQTNSSIDPTSTLTEQHMASDSVHLYMFDLIHLIGTNFIQTTSGNSNSPSYQVLRKRNQQILLEKIIQKLTSTVQPAAMTSQNDNQDIQRHASSVNNSGTNLVGSSNTATASTSSGSSSSSRRSCNILLNLTRNKLSLMSLCAQYVEPNDLDLFNEFYMNILCSITSILLNLNINTQNSDAQIGGSFDSLEIINLKFSIILKLLEKFSFVNLSKLIKGYRADEVNDANIEELANDVSDICCQFVDTNIHFLLELKLTTSNQNEHIQIILNENNLKLIIEQCIDNFVSILNIDYPFYFDYMLRKCLEFSSKPGALKYGCRHMSQFNLVTQQRELTFGSNEKTRLNREKFLQAFEFLGEFFEFERSKFTSKKLSFYSHWFSYARNIHEIYTNLFTVFIDRFCVNDLVRINYSGVIHDELITMLMSQFIEKYNKLWDILIGLYMIWIEPESIKELTSQSLINVTEIYENEIAKGAFKNTAVFAGNSGSAVLVMINSFLNLFNTVVERLNLFMNVNEKLDSNELCSRLLESARNYVLNKFFHFYYEKIASVLNNSTSINDNTLDCYHRCISKYAPVWFENGCFEPDYHSINIMNEICWSANPRQLKFLAFDLVAYLDLSKISESYFRKQEIMPQQINDLLKCWLQLLTEFCLRDSIRESKLFDTLLRPVFNQAEILQCWSMLSDTAYMDVIMNKFCGLADYHYVFASRGTDRGLLMNLLKSSAEFNSLADQNSLSCFSSAKRRCYLKAICQILLKPSLETINCQMDAFQSCIMNLLTDIETFSISSESENKFLKHEIQLLIDECLVLITRNQINNEVTEVYRNMFESWLTSSKDSPILIHFINRLSRNLVDQSSSQHYLLELCIQVFFETDHGENLKIKELQYEEDKLFPDVKTLNTYESNSIGWQQIMDNIEFKLNFAGYDYQSSSRKISNPNCNLFEYKFLEDSSYLLLYAYMTQRLAMFKANYGEKSNQFLDIMLNYMNQILSRFENSYKTDVKVPSHPRPENEEKFCLVLNFLFKTYIFMMQNSSSSCKEKVGEQLVKISNLLIFYGEDVLSNQNPINDGQSIGSDLLSSIGLNLLAKKSPFSLLFRVYCRCMAVCILKRIKLTDGVYVSNDNQDSSSSSPGRFNPSESGEQLVFNQQFKQASYQYHLIFQTKTYAGLPELSSIEGIVGKGLKHPNNSDFDISGIIEINKNLSKVLFKNKYFLC